MIRALPLALLVTTASASPQWSKDPALDLLLSDGAGAEVQAKLASGSEGRTFVSWYDSDPSGSPAFGYDVKLQSLGPDGAPEWAPGGVLVADRGFSSTQDYALDSGPSGDAWLAFRDDRFSGVQITAARYDAAGNALWGPTGVQLTSTSAFVASPRLTTTSDGECVVAWSEDNVVRVQRLDAAGVPQWGTALTLPAPPGGAVLASDLASDADSGAILAYVLQPSGFLGPKHLYVQRLSPGGTPMWPTPGVPVFTASSLQFGNFPEILADGSGGTIATWYGTGPLQCYAQHVLSDGSLAYPAGGTQLSLDTSHVRVSPSAAYDAATDTAVYYWTELSSGQSQRGVWGQRLDATGNRLWGPNGASFVPLGSDDISYVRCAQTPTGSAAVWFQSAGFGNAQVRGVNVDDNGVALSAVTTIASSTSSKDDLVVMSGPFGDLLCAWHGDAGGDNDVRAKNMLASGLTGQQAGAVFRNAGTNAASYSVDVGPLGGSLVASVDLSGSTHPVALLFLQLAPAEIPFGSQFILVNINNPSGGVLSLAPAFGPLAQWSLPIPNSAALCGLLLSTQAVHAGGAAPLELTNANDVYLGLQ